MRRALSSSLKLACPNCENARCSWRGELAIARAYRAPEMLDAYRAELAAGGWPLSELEEAALTPVYRAFRVGMAAAEMEDGLVTGAYDLAMIERQLARTATAAPL